MAREIPEAVRAVAGLAATVLDEARKLPETLPGLPVRVLGMAMQVSMKLQQHYAGLVARGDELFTGMRGEDEPGLATFDDDDDEPGAAAAPGFRDSAFDRVGAAASTVAEEVLEEFAIDEMVEDRPVTEDADAVENALLESDRATQDTSGGVPSEVDVVTPDGEIATAEATVTDEGIAAPERQADTAGDAEASARAAAAAPIVVQEGEIAVDDALGSGADTAQDTAAPAPAAPAAAAPEAAAPEADGDRRLGPPLTAPIDGYDDFSIAQLRGRLRGYAAPTVQKLVQYEEATRAREPYLRMLRNRLEKLAAG